MLLLLLLMLPLLLCLCLFLLILTYLPHTHSNPSPNPNRPSSDISISGRRCSTDASRPTVPRPLVTITRPSSWADSRLSLSLVSVSRPYLGSDDFSRPRLFGRYPALSRGRVSAISRSFLVRLTLDRSCSAASRPSLGYRRSADFPSTTRDHHSTVNLGRLSALT